MASAWDTVAACDRQIRELEVELERAKADLAEARVRWATGEAALEAEYAPRLEALRQEEERLAAEAAKVEAERAALEAELARLSGPQ